MKPGKTSGAELQKKRPYVVISADAMGNLPVKIVIPLRTWQERFKGFAWLVPVAATPATGLRRDVAADSRRRWQSLSSTHSRADPSGLFELRLLRAHADGESAPLRVFCHAADA